MEVVSKYVRPSLAPATQIRQLPSISGVRTLINRTQRSKARLSTPNHGANALEKRIAFFRTINALALFNLREHSSETWHPYRPESLS